MGEIILKTSFLKTDVKILLKDISGKVEPLGNEEREKLIQSGVNYCEMLPIEYKPSIKYMELYNSALREFSKDTAMYIQILSEKIYTEKGDSVILVSLARAGTPIGILIKKYLEKKYNISVSHYTISIIRGVGIDDNAMKYILDNHNPEDIQFVDGWTGKGAILGQLEKALIAYPNVSSSLAVLSDPANITTLCGTHEDFLIASSCLNSTVCGLISRTFFRRDIIGENDFHGAVIYDELSSEDRTYEFIDTVFDNICFDDTDNFLYNKKPCRETQSNILGIDEINIIAKEFDIDNINFIKPGVGETTRVLLRRVPDMILISENAPKEYVNHIIKLAEEKNVKVITYPLTRYNCCGIIKQLADV